MNDLLLWFAMLFAGLVSLWLGVRTLRGRLYEDHVSVIEASILKLGNAEPLPLTKFDRVWGRIQAWLMVVFGALLTFTGGLFAATSLFELE